MTAAHYATTLAAGIAPRIEMAMKLRGLDMKALSKKAELGETYARDVLKRQLNPTCLALLKLSHALDVRPEWLLCGTGEMEA